MTLYLSSDGLEFGDKKLLQDKFPGSQVVVGNEKIAKDFLEKEGIVKFEEKHFITPSIFTDENGEFWSINIVVSDEDEVYCDNQISFLPYGTEDWQTKHQRIAGFLESIETDQALMSHYLKGLSFVTGHILSQTDADNWEEMKRTAFGVKDFGKIAEKAREWRGDRTPSTPMYWAYEILAISLECFASNDPTAVECEEFTNGIIKKAIQDFPIPGRKPTTELNSTIGRVPATNEEIGEETTQDIKKVENFKNEKGSLLDANLKVGDKYSDQGFLVVEEHKKSAEEVGAPQIIKDNWNVIRSWLEIDGGEDLGPGERKKITSAFKAYLAIGIAPRVKLNPVFEEASKYYKAAGYDLEPDKPPSEVLEAFDGIFGTDEEMKRWRQMLKNIGANFDDNLSLSDD